MPNEHRKSYELYGFIEKNLLIAEEIEKRRQLCVKNTERAYEA